MLVIAEVGDVSQAGDAGLVEVDFSGASFETVDEVAAEEFLDHFGVEAADLGGLREVGEQGLNRGFRHAGELILVGHGGYWDDVHARGRNEAFSANSSHCFLSSLERVFGISMRATA